jgi:hypothetical protein
LVDVNAVVGFLVTWTIRKTRPEFKSSRRSDDVDEALETLGGIVTSKLDDTLVGRVNAEISRNTQLGSRLKLRVVRALETAIAADPVFAQALDDSITTLRTLAAESADPADPPPPLDSPITNTFTGTVHGSVLQIGRIQGDITLGPDSK